MAKRVTKSDGAIPEIEATRKPARRPRAASAIEGDGAPQPRRTRTANPNAAAARARKSVTMPRTREIAADSGGAAEALAAAPPAPTHDQIAWRAYEIYQRRGGAPGNPVEDWLQAEAELRANR